MAEKVLKPGKIVVTFMDGHQICYTDVTNLSLSRDWAFIKFTDGGRIQIPTIAIKELCEEATVFVRSIKAED